MKRPLVSVVIPSFNHERFVAQAIESVFAQTYPELELVVIDDGSKDGSGAAIRKALANAPAGLRAQYFARKNSGAHAAISFGLSKASGEYLTILNSDDYYHPERIETLVAVAKKCESELLFSLLEMVSETGERLSGSVREVLWYHQAVSLRHYLPTLGFALLRDNLAVTTGNLFFTKGLLGKVGSFRPYRYMHDMDFILRSLAFTEPKLVSRKLLYYRLHTANTIRSGKDGFEGEGRRILDDFMKTAATGKMPNRFAPCLAYWPRYFSCFIAEHHPFFSESKIGHYLEQSGDVGLRPSSSDPDGAAQRFQALPSLTGICIHLLDRSREPSEPLALLAHAFKDEKLPGKPECKIGTRFLVRLSAPALPGGRKASAIALVYDDRILATAGLSQVTDGGMECSFVVSNEFGGLDLKRTRFLMLEEEPAEYPSGFALHAGAAPAPVARLEASSEFEPLRLSLAEQAYEIRSASGDGRIDRIHQSREGDWILEGSAFDSVSGEVPTGVLLFDGDSRLFARYEARFQNRPGGAADRVGFKLVIPSAQLRKPGTSVIRAIAIFRRGIAFHLGLIDRAGKELSRMVRPSDMPPEQLERVSRTAAGWRYESSQGSREWTIGKWHYGFVDLIDRSPARLTIHGWAIEPPTGLMPEAILVTANGKPMAFTRLNAERPDLCKAHKLRSPLVAGFRLELDPVHGAATIQAFALWPTGAATELPEYGARPAARQQPRPPLSDKQPQLSL